MRLAYPTRYERSAEGDWVVTFPDLPEAVTGSETLAAARELAADALEEVLLSYLAAGEPLPEASPLKAGEDLTLVDLPGRPI